MKLATTTGDFLAYVGTPAEAVQMYDGTGFRYLDYNFFKAAVPGSPFLTDSWKNEVIDALRAAERLGIQFVQAHAPCYNPLDPTQDHELGVHTTLRAIEACSMLGIENIVVHAGFHTDYLYPQDKERFFHANALFFSALFPAMEKYHVNVLIENIPEGNTTGRYSFQTGKEMKDFIHFMNHPLLHACWDTGHANIGAADQRMELCALGDELRALHVQDNFGTFDEHIAPFMGTINFDSVMQGLLDVNYQGYFTFEADVLNRWDEWPHARLHAPDCRTLLQNPSAQLKREAVRFLYQIGKFILQQYDCFEI